MVAEKLTLQRSIFVDVMMCVLKFELALTLKLHVKSEKQAIAECNQAELLLNDCTV